MLDYISVDYPAFVRNGQVLNPQEYQEQREFAQAVVKIVEHLPIKPQKSALVKQAQELLAAIEGKAEGEKVAATAHRLHASKHSRFSGRRSTLSSPLCRLPRR
jgi:high-affinity iron transporter